MKQKLKNWFRLWYYRIFRPKAIFNIFMGGGIVQYKVNDVIRFESGEEAIIISMCSPKYPGNVQAIELNTKFPLPKKI